MRIKCEVTRGTTKHEVLLQCHPRMALIQLVILFVPVWAYNYIYVFIYVYWKCQNWSVYECNVWRKIISREEITPALQHFMFSHVHDILYFDLLILKAAYDSHYDLTYATGSLFMVVPCAQIFFRYSMTYNSVE